VVHDRMGDFNIEQRTERDMKAISGVKLMHKRKNTKHLIS